MCEGFEQFFSIAGHVGKAINIFEELNNFQKNAIYSSCKHWEEKL